MGQMESKVFEVEMPQSVKIDSWKGVKASVMLLVRTNQAHSGRDEYRFVCTWVESSNAVDQVDTLFAPP